MQMFQLCRQIGKTGFQLKAEPVKNGKISLIDTMHVSSDGGWLDVRGIVVADIKHIVAFMLISPN